MRLRESQASAPSINYSAALHDESTPRCEQLFTTLPTTLSVKPSFVLMRCEQLLPRNRFSETVVWGAVAGAAVRAGRQSTSASEQRENYLKRSKDWFSETVVRGSQVQQFGLGVFLNVGCQRPDLHAEVLQVCRI